jgi:hypothetical protein
MRLVVLNTHQIQHMHVQSLVFHSDHHISFISKINAVRYPILHATEHFLGQSLRFAESSSILPTSAIISSMFCCAGSSPSCLSNHLWLSSGGSSQYAFTLLLEICQNSLAWYLSYAGVVTFAARKTRAVGCWGVESLENGLSCCCCCWADAAWFCSVGWDAVLMTSKKSLLDFGYSCSF